MSLYDLTDPGALTAPVFLAAFDGWVSAGSAGTATAEHIAGDGPVIVTFSSDELFDYRVNRPAVEFAEGVITTIDWPQVTVRHRGLGERDLLIVTGPEPNWGWRRFAAAMVELAGRFGVVEHVSLGGIPWATPHTRPTEVVTTTSRPGLLGDDADPPEGILRVPGSVANVVDRALAETGTPTAGFWARVPSYIGTTYYPAVVTLVERLTRHLGVTIPLGSLVDEAREQRRQLDAIVEAQPQARAIVERMESLAAAESEAVSGEDLAAEIERFLREAGEAGGFGGDGDR